MMGWNWSWWGWTAMTIAMVAFWGTLLWLLAGASPRPRRDAERRPEDVLADRLARGDIDVEEYRRRVAVLHGESEAGVR